MNRDKFQHDFHWRLGNLVTFSVPISADHRSEGSNKDTFANQRKTVMRQAKSLSTLLLPRFDVKCF